MKHRGDLPTGTVTFLFSDVEGSTQLLQRLGDRYVEILERHNELLRQAFEHHAGTVVGTEGDSFFVVFPAARDALAAAIDAQVALSGSNWPQKAEVRVRMGLHTGSGILGGDNYVGIDVHRAARIAAAGHGGQILLSASTRALVEHDLQDGVVLRDLGDHRLKDLQQPERLHQVVDARLQESFPPMRTQTARPNNLPMETSAFLGRTTELDTLRGLFEASTVRLLTLTGPGGIGKTRLALQVAAEQSEGFEDGIFLVDLAPVRDPDAVFEVILSAVGLSPSEGHPLEAVAQQLESRRILLVLDNMEQVIDAADGVVELLRRCPHVRVLVTSREALAVRGEQIFAVPPLGLPPEGIAKISAEAAAQYEAVRLFVDRARQARPGFALTDHNARAVADICARLDGLPLAIELAAARVKLFSPHDLRDRLHNRLQLLRGGPRDLPARQQTLRNAIEWSYELLDTDEQLLLGVLSLFSTARLEAVEAVAVRLERLRDVDVVDQLTSLVDKSLVRSVEEADSQRLSMLGTIREYAGERLEQSASISGAAKQAHAEYYSELARAAHERLHGRERDAALTELAAELGNLRRAWRHWLAAGDLRELDDLLQTLWSLHEGRGWYKAAVELAEDLLALLSAIPSSPDRVDQKVMLATTVARGLLAIRGYTEDVDEAYRRALALLTQAGGLPQLFPVLRNLASLYLYRAEFDKAAALGHQLLELAERQDQVGLKLEGHLVLGTNLASLGDVHTGVDHLEQAVALSQSGEGRSAPFRLGANPGVVAHTTSAFLLWPLGFPDRAVARAEAAVALANSLNHPFTQAYTLFHVGFLALWQGEMDHVQQRANSALKVAEEHDYQIWRALALLLQGVAMTGLGNARDGLARADQGMSLYRGLDTPPVFWPLLLTIRARSFGLAGRPADGLVFIDEAIASFGGRTNFLYPEMPLLKGDLLLAASGADEAEPWFQRAFEIGGAVGARMSQLRAATRLTRLRRGSSTQPGEGDILRSVYDTFTEGWDTADLVEARALLDT